MTSYFDEAPLTDQEKYEQALMEQQADREFGPLKTGEFCWVPNLEARFPNMTDQEFETLKVYGRPLLDLLGGFNIYPSKIGDGPWQLRQLDQDEIDDLDAAMEGEDTDK
jgi:hypothetical protein